MAMADDYLFRQENEQEVCEIEVGNAYFVGNTARVRYCILVSPRDAIQWIKH